MLKNLHTHTEGKINKLSDNNIDSLFEFHLDSDIKIENLSGLVLNDGLTNHILQMEKAFGQVGAEGKLKERGRG